jgi:phosphoglycerate kinase
MNLDFHNKRVLVRVDFNVPLNAEHEITDNTRILKALPTLKKLQEEGAKIILMSHLGRPQKKRLENGEIDVLNFTLRHLVSTLSELLGTSVKFADDCISGEARLMSERLEAGEVLLLENTRFYKEESAGDIEFAVRLSKLGDVFVNDAFGTAHRAHASTTIVANYFKKSEKCFGYLLEQEINNADKVLKSPARPCTAILGGAKVSDKIKLIERLIDFANNIIIGGGMTYTFIKAMGGEVGNSLCEDEFLDLAKDLIEKAKEQSVDIILPEDTIAADHFSNDAHALTVDTMHIPEDYMGLDIGPKAIQSFSKVIENSKTIIWNGPVGVFEFEQFSKGSFSIAKSIAAATSRGAFSLIGGGDSVSAINKSGLADQVSFISTGGGAMLEYLEGKQLPAIQAILQEDQD